MRIVIIGCGRIGAHVARCLSAAGNDVCVVDNDLASLSRLGERFRGQTVAGPGFDQTVLEQAQVARADAVVVLTNVDATNFMVARAVTELFGVRRVSVRVNDPEFAPVFAELGIDILDLPDLVLSRVRQSLPTAAPGEDGRAAPGTGR